MKIVLDDVNSGYNLSAINDNFEKIEQALQDEVLYRNNPVGEPNSMQNALDMNANRIINLPEPTSPTEPLRLQDFTNVQLATDPAIAAHVAAPDPHTQYQTKANLLDNSDPTKGAALVARTVEVFDDLGDAVSSSLPVGRACRTLGYYAAGDGGGADYIVSPPGSPSDGFFNHTLPNGNVLSLATSSKFVNIQYGGAKPDGVTDSLAVFNAAIANGYTIFAPGKYFLSGKFDAGVSDTNKMAQIIGLSDRNFDGDQSQLIFDGTDGIEVFAGCKIHNIELYNRSASKVGTGLKCDDVHAADLRRVTVTNFDVGYDLFLWASLADNLIAYQCGTGFRVVNESTSTTYRSCYAKDSVTGFDLSGAFTYSTLLNCAVDNCDVPYRFRGGSNVDLSNCGAEISHANIEGFFMFSTEDSPATVSISGGRFVMLGGRTCQSIVYAPAGSPNNFGRILFSRINTNTFTNPTGGFVKGTPRVLLDSSCAFSDAFNLQVVPDSGGGRGSITQGYETASGQNYTVTGVTIQGLNTSDKNNLKAGSLRVVSGPQVTASGHFVFIKGYATQSTSLIFGRVVAYGKSATDGILKSSFVFSGGNNAHFVNEVGSLISFKINAVNTDGFPCLVLNNLPSDDYYIRIEADGYPDAGYRDAMFNLIVGPKQWP